MQKEKCCWIFNGDKPEQMLRVGGVGAWGQEMEAGRWKMLVAKKGQELPHKDPAFLHLVKHPK